MCRSACLGAAGVLLAALCAVTWSRGGVDGQDRRPASPASSLELGPPYDQSSKLRFERMLDVEESRRLIMLRSRYALADAACPVPSLEARAPLYVKFDRPLTRTLAQAMQERGVSPIGYLWPNTSVVRARGAQSLESLRKWLLSTPEVLGTLVSLPEDVCSRGVLESAGTRDLQLLFWRDTDPAEAEALLAGAGAALLEATLEQGRLSLDTPLVSVRVSDAGLQVLARSPWLERIELMPRKVADNQTSVSISNAQPAVIGVAPYNLDGTNQIVGVWDNGPARDTHEQFQNAPVPSLIGAGTKRVLRVDTQSFQDHGTHVTGTIVGDGTGNATAKGYAPKAYALAHFWSNVDQKRRNAKHNWNHVADNHSYSAFGGGSDDWGEYTADCQVNDWTNRDFLMNMVQSAGNYASSNPGGAGPKPYTGGTQTVGSFNAHRNGFIIGAVQDNLDITSFSSRGPCDDGRLVPQFCANGEGLTSCINTGGNQAYASYSGTSMSGPSVCGGLTLLSQLWRRENSQRILEPDTARALLALTCADRGNTGPDYIYGFGIVDVKAAADVILADVASGRKQIVRGALRQGEVVEYSLTIAAGTPSLRVACSWLDIYASTTAQVAVVNDLDLELVDPSNQVRYPYAGLLQSGAGAMNHLFTTTGPNRRDNIELCHVSNPAPGLWKVRVRGFSIPANPQVNVPNDVTGFVLASNLPLASRQHLTFEDSLNTGTPVSIPDNNATGVVRSFNVSDPRVINHVRVYTRVVHDRRGDIEILLESPTGTFVNLKTVNSGDEDDYTDVIGVFPDTRQYDDDITVLHHRHIAGLWKVHVRDRVATNTGTLNYLALEFEVRVNNDPLADSGIGFSVRENLGAQLNASASSDPDGDPVTFAWTQISGSPAVALSGANSATPSFTAPSVSADTVLTFQVTVTDRSGDFDTDTVQVTILNNAAPTAAAGSDFAVREGLPVVLDAGASSNAEADPLTYQWSQISGLSVSLSGAATAVAGFTAPAVALDEILVFEVKVTDDRGDYTTDQVQVTVLNNAAPVADAGPDQALLEGSVVQLNASASSDAESDPLTFSWVQVGGMAVTLTAASTPMPTFTSMSVTQNEILVFEVTVSDDRGDFTTDTVSITVENNLPPTAQAGPDAAVARGLPVVLDGSASHDSNTGDSLAYQWVQVSGPPVVLSTPSGASAGFTAPAFDAALEFELTVTDSLGLSASDRVRIYVTKDGNFPKKKKDEGGCSASESSDALAGLFVTLALLALVLRLRRRIPSWLS